MTSLVYRLVLSTKAHAKIVNIDYTKALELDGVVGYVCSQDLSSDCNKFGLIERDEEIFSSEKVYNYVLKYRYLNWVQLGTIF